MSIIDDGPSGEKGVRMAYLAVVASHTVNGVAAIHSDIIRDTIFKDFADLWPAKFQNKTNGVTPRRWLAFCNPPLRALISETLGSDAWITDLAQLEGLKAKAADPAFCARWREVKAVAKARALARVEELTGVRGAPGALLDIQVKRIHEYKRQLMNVLGIVWRYDQIKQMGAADRAKVVPRTVVIGGKAAPGYDMAKRIIKLVCAVADKVNGDPDVGDLLKVGRRGGGVVGTRARARRGGAGAFPTTLHPPPPPPSLSCRSPLCPTTTSPSRRSSSPGPNSTNRFPPQAPKRPARAT